jgi:hypothetical protein
MHMRTQYDYDLLPITRTCTCTCAYNTALPITCTCASNTIALTMAFPSLHTTTWEHNYMDLAHNTARLVCCVYKEGEYNTCVGAACTSSIELTCSRTCANCAWVCIYKRRRHAHTTIRFLIGISRIAYRLHGHGTWACTRPSLAHNTARLVCCVSKEGEYNTCVGAACTSSIELTCSCACGRMALHVQTTTLGNLQSHARCVSCTYTRGMFQYSIMHVPSIVSCMFQYSNKLEEQVAVLQL